MFDKTNWWCHSYSFLEIKKLWRDKPRWSPRPTCGTYDLYHRWSIFTMYWPAISIYALIGVETYDGKAE